MTLPGFVERGRVIASLPSLGLLTLAACTPPGVEVVYAELDTLEAGAWEALKAETYDLVAISALTARILEAYQLADRLRAQGVPVVLGGLHVTALPEEASGHADAIVIGEAERAWPALVVDFQSGGLKPRYSAKDLGAANLGEVPIPRYDLLRGREYNRITLQASRGCPLDCSFCGASRLLGGYRTKPVHRVEAELAAIMEIWPRPFLELADDNTFASREWGKDLMRMFARHPLRWFTETDLSIADDPALLEEMAAAGCAQVLVGLESTSARALHGLDRRNWKAAQVDHQLAAIQRIQSKGIPVNGCFVLGLDDDEGSFDAIRTFVDESGLCDVQITLLTPFPGTALHAKLKREGRLFREVYWDECTLFDLTFQPSRISAEALRQGFMDLMVDLYGAPAQARRRSAFHACLKRRPASEPMAH